MINLGQDLLSGWMVSAMVSTERTRSLRLQWCWSGTKEATLMTKGEGEKEKRCVCYLLKEEGGCAEE